MNPFELLFVLLFLGSVGYGGWILSLIIRRRWAEVRRHGARWSVAAMAYMLVVVVVGFASSRRVVVDQPLRYDDWQIAVERVGLAESLGSNITASPGSRFVIVTVRVTSTAKRVSQAAPAGALVYLIDKDDTRYDVSSRGQQAFEERNGAQPELTTKLGPGGSFETTRVFEVPRAVEPLALGHRHGTGSFFPGAFIIGEGFHKAAVIRLPLQKD